MTQHDDQIVIDIKMRINEEKQLSLSIGNVIECLRLIRWCSMCVVALAKAAAAIAADCYLIASIKCVPE